MKSKRNVTQRSFMQKVGKKKKKEIVFKLPNIHIGGGKK